MLNFLHYNIMLCLQNIPQICRIAHQHQHTGPALQTLSAQHAQPQKHCRTKRYIGIKVEGRCEGNVDNQRGQAYYEKDIENVAADDITDGNICVTAACRRYRGEQLRQRGASSHNRQADKTLAESCIGCNRCCCAYGYITAGNNQRQAANCT